MTPKEIALQKISQLVNRFDEQVDSYMKGDYNEAKTRQDFINPFFKALGWDIDNENDYAEAYREVVYEDKVKVGGGYKSPRLFLSYRQRQTVILCRSKETKRRYKRRNHTSVSSPQIWLECKTFRFHHHRLSRICNL